MKNSEFLNYWSVDDRISYRRFLRIESIRSLFDKSYIPSKNISDYNLSKYNSIKYNNYNSLIKETISYTEYVSGSVMGYNYIGDNDIESIGYKYI